MSNIALVKPEKARALEDNLMKQAQGGNIKQKITEDILLSILEKMEGKATKVIVKFLLRYQGKSIRMILMTKLI